MISIRCTYTDESFYKELVDMCEEFKGVTTLGFNSSYYDSKKKGYLKCKSAFAAKMDPFIGVWINNIPTKGFYSETNECTIDDLKQYLLSLPEHDFREDDAEQNDSND